MSKIALISCSKSKKPTATAAALLYDSPLFRKSLLYGLTTCDTCYILSAKHHLIALNKIISPYNVTLKDLSPGKKMDWGHEVLAQLKAVAKPRDEIILLAGREYHKPLDAGLRSLGLKIRLPIGDLAFGKRLQKLSELNNEVTLQRTYAEFYSVLRKLYVGQNGGRLLKECTGKLEWPKRGIYFFLEPTEKLNTKKYAPLLQRND